MKTIRIVNILIIMLNLLLLVNCTKEEDPNFNQEKLMGQWASYEMIVDGETFSQFALFNTFATAIEFSETGYSLFIKEYRGENRSDAHFLEWVINEDTLILFHKNRKLWKTSEIEKLDNTELWLRYEEHTQIKLVKFKRI